MLFQDVDARYRGADGRIHTAQGYRKHAIFSLWDTFRAAHPLFTLIDPNRVDDLVNSMLSFYDEHGLLPVWSLVGNETNTMTGHHAVPVIADAYRKGFRGFDAEKALEAMVKSANQDHRGLEYYKAYRYIPTELENESVTKTLEYAFDDWAIASMARDLQVEDVYEHFIIRSSWWSNLLDPDTRFMRGKTAAGDWAEPFDPRRSDHREGTDYTEGNAWQHTWFVPHDVRGLMEGMGGEEAFLSKLDSLFEMDSEITGENVSADISGLIGQYAHGNEPSHHIAYLYNYAGQPWKTADRVRAILTSQYDDTPFGLSGNEDCGQMTAWYVLSALGIYPVNPADGNWVLGSPLFPEATIELGGGRTFTIQAPGVSADRPYIQSARLNGKALDRSYLRHAEIAGGGVLELEMGSTPSEWGTSREARPPSQSDDRFDRLAAESALASSTRLSPDAEMAEAVKAEFLHAWRGYLEYARGMDALRPLSRSGRNWYDASMVMTPLDAFDTMLLMGLEEDAAVAKALILNGLSFDHDFPVQIFEVTIRILGGLLTAYQMDGDPRFLELATDLGNRMLPAFESATGMPYVRVNLRTGEREWQVNNPAEIGTLMLEFGALSRLTGNPAYYDAAKAGVQAVFLRRSAIGLVGTTIDVETGEWENTSSHLSGMIDSYYEYLLKAWLLFDDPDFRDMWESRHRARKPVPRRRGKRKALVRAHRHAHRGANRHPLRSPGCVLARGFGPGRRPRAGRPPHGVRLSDVDRPSTWNPNRWITPPWRWCRGVILSGPRLSSRPTSCTPSPATPATRPWGGTSSSALSDGAGATLGSPTWRMSGPRSRPTPWKASSWPKPSNTPTSSSLQPAPWTSTKSFSTPRPIP